MKKDTGKNSQNRISVKILFSICLASQSATASDTFFTDIASKEGSGIDYRSYPLPSNQILESLKQQPVVDFASIDGRSAAPGKPRGAPGVALLDYDNDGDVDIYVTNAKDYANSLFSNQLRETGEIKFVNVAKIARVELVDQASTGVCFGDIDNDGDQDIFVVGNFGTGNRLLENNGNGTFSNLVLATDVLSSDKHSTSCSMGDVNNDGLLDIVVANSYDNWDNRLPLVKFEFDYLMESNQVFINKGNNVFVDESENSGIKNINRVTWAIALVDYDQDGDVDIISADDQGAKPPKKDGGENHGYIRVFNNDGQGHFTDLTEIEANTNRVGAWMGLSFGDINGDGFIDMFATNVGYYFSQFISPIMGVNSEPGEWASGWFLGGENGVFVYPGLGKLIDDPFGWGTSIFDYDNDGDSDIVYYGGLNMGGFIDASNPGVILRNEENYEFVWDKNALNKSTEHNRRNVQGVAVGDINNDGYPDIVTVSSENWPNSYPLIPYLSSEQLIGLPFDETAYIWPTYFPVNSSNPFEGFIWSGFDSTNGTLSVELNSADNENNWVKIAVFGSKGIVDGAKVNRDGIGAVVKFTPRNGTPTIWPVVAGASYASQDSLKWVFGLGKAEEGTMEVLWPGGGRNSLYEIEAGEDIILAEIPCERGESRENYRDYLNCVSKSISQLKKHNILNKKQAIKYYESAVRSNLLKDHR